VYVHFLCYNDWKYSIYANELMVLTLNWFKQVTCLYLKNYPRTKTSLNIGKKKYIIQYHLTIIHWNESNHINTGLS